MTSSTVNSPKIERAAPVRKVIHPWVRELETHGAGALSDFDRECLEKIPPAELRAIHDRAVQDMRSVFEHAEELCLPRGACTHCSPFKEHQYQYMISDVLRGESWCAFHWMEKKERDFCREYLEAHRPKLDLEDFAKI